MSREVEGCSRETYKSYKQRINQFLRFIGPIGIEEIQRQHVENYLLYLIELRRSPHYVDACFRALRTFFNWCVLENVVGQSPMRNMKPPRLPKRAKPFLTINDRDKLLSANPQSTFTGARNTAIIMLFWTTGMRLSELAGLRLADLQWGNKGRIKVFGKGSRERFVPFEPEAQKALWRYLSYRADGIPDLWVSEQRKPLNKWGIIQVLRRSGQRAGVKVKDVSHIFRRTWAWERIKEGVHIKYIMLIGGWATIDVLLQYVKAIEVEEALDNIREKRKVERTRP